MKTYVSSHIPGFDFNPIHLPSTGMYKTPLPMPQKNAFLLDTIINIKVYYYTNNPIDESVIDDAFCFD